jgi:hypothetical protein
MVHPAQSAKVRQHGLSAFGELDDVVDLQMESAAAARYDAGPVAGMVRVHEKTDVTSQPLSTTRRTRAVSRYC